MAAEQEGQEKRGPKGGVRHQPGRGHDRKSAREKKRRFARKMARRRRRREKDARKQWEQWDQLPEEVKKLLGPAGQPKVPRPSDEQ
jgi:hypothetical protein